MVNNDSLETEIKVWCPDLAAVAAQLERAGAERGAPRVFERNNRYDSVDGLVGARGQVLRLRQDSRARLTFKEPGTSVDGVVSRYEAEVEVSDFDTIDQILMRLGYVTTMVYEKYRTTWHLGSCEVVLDELPFGNFVEIEGSYSAIMGALETLNLADAPRIKMSYISAFKVIRDRLDLSFDDATFAHFSDMELPASVLKWLLSAGRED
jgi:adenylate cyclase class 2